MRRIFGKMEIAKFLPRYRHDHNNLTVHKGSLVTPLSAATNTLASFDADCAKGMSGGGVFTDTGVLAGIRTLCVWIDLIECRSRLSAWC